MAAVHTDTLYDLVARHLGTTYEISVSGELDLASADVLADAIRDGLTLAPETLVVDLQQVTFLDSSGLRVLIESRHRALKMAVKLVVLRPEGPADRVFALCGVDALFPRVEASRAEARFARPAPEAFLTEWSL
ncbi:MAG: STAS domain-containing protein [Solirubrobacteraceae bacterium]